LKEVSPGPFKNFKKKEKDRREDSYLYMGKDCAVPMVLSQEVGPLPLLLHNTRFALWRAINDRPYEIAKIFALSVCLWNFKGKCKT
jgi:hypothetical protein